MSAAAIPLGSSAFLDLESLPAERALRCVFRHNFRHSDEYYDENRGHVQGFILRGLLRCCLGFAGVSSGGLGAEPACARVGIVSVQLGDQRRGGTDEVCSRSSETPGARLLRVVAEETRISRSWAMLLPRAPLLREALAPTGWQMRPELIL